MSIVLPSVLNLSQQKVEKYIQDEHLRSMYEQVGIGMAQSLYLRGQFANIEDVLIFDKIGSRVAVF